MGQFSKDLATSKEVVDTWDLQGKTQSISNSRGIFPSFGPGGNRNFIPT